ncbi:LysR family transcriptional regulator [Mesorhizobium sp. CA8]|uniref:LysR substrate-binding domain-containing protein n=1 Tax=unclassified Mesorhizobium TaxID=325217 RepID=UPI001CC9AE12|nr:MULTISPECIES: LysR substrate-binding domain-containing protein [unclassified Mesorhizobium]MBZ9761715.1 LysR family transcriptional regulator [Mesorhizobium sp. CA8]MBZ9820531.1 LysR family transcriptional regulator [Mesorhizobium sp. CA4]
MTALRSMLPPLHSLVAFEAAARKMNFTKAGSELNVSQAAISRQIRVLEDDLGVKLFHRSPTGLKLSPEGSRLFAAVNDSLVDIAEACTDLRRIVKPSSVTITASISFSIFWLASLLSDLRARHPTIDIRLIMNDPFVSPDVGNCDIAIRYGTGNWRGWRAFQLFGEEIIPVCTPDMKERFRDQLNTPTDLLALPLLWLDMTDPGGLDWRTWFRDLGIYADIPPAGAQFNNYAVMIEVARAGHGICLALRSLVQRLLDAGALTEAIPIGVRTPRAYYMALPEERIETRATTIVVSWLKEEAAKSAKAMEQHWSPNFEG